MAHPKVVLALPYPFPGDTALVGAPQHDVGDNADQGSVYVFVRTGTTWSFQQQLTAPDGAAGDSFGYAVSLFGDSALVGAPFDDVGANDAQGSAYVFVRTGTTWSFQQKLTAPDGAAEDSFGTSVSLFEDSALAGMPEDDIGGNLSQGSAYVFARTGTTWSFQQKLTAPDGAAGDFFGTSVSLFEDSALVSAPFDDVGANDAQGSAYVFVRTGTMWSFQQKLTAPDGAANDSFGSAVSLSGESALVGAAFKTIGGSPAQGSAYVFVRTGTTWSFQQQLTDADGAYSDLLGFSVSLSGDTALAGAPLDGVGAASSQGSVSVFTRTGTTWSFQQKLIAADGSASDFFGYAVTVSGETVLAGAPYDDAGGIADLGSAYLYRADATPYVDSITRADPNPTGAGSVAFRVTFSEAVSDVDSADFSLSTTGTLSGSRIDSVSGSGAIYTVAVTTGRGCGSLRLDLAADATITDEAGLSLTNLPYVDGEAYSVLYAIYLPQVIGSDS